MANSKDDLRSLVEGLYNSTLSGKIIWTKVSNAESFITSLKSSSVEIKDDINNRGEPVIVINIYDKNGTQIESFNDDYFISVKPYNLSYDTYYDAMKSLHEMSRRSATGADKLIQNILSEIGAPSVDDDIPF